jgi:hypothetical protein
MQTSASRIRNISLVCVTTRTADQDRAIEFYEKLGFEKRTGRRCSGSATRVDTR